MVSLISPPSPTCSQMEGLKEVVGHLLGTFPIPLMERAVMAATDLLPKYPALGVLAAPFLDNCARTLLLQVRTDKQVKEFLKKHAGTEREQMAVRLKAVMEEVARDPSRATVGGGAAKSTVTVTKEMLRKIQREQRQKDKEEAEKLAKEERLAASKKKRERKLSKHEVQVTAGTKEDEYNVEEVLAALGETKKPKTKRKAKRVTRAVQPSDDPPQSGGRETPPQAVQHVQQPTKQVEWCT